MLQIRRFSKDKLIAVMIVIIASIIGYWVVLADDKTDYVIFMSCFLTSLMIVTLSDLINYKIVSNLLLFIGIFLFGTIMAFRAQLGTDDIQYEYLFNRAYGKTIAEYFATSGIEKGYMTLNYILYYLTKGDYNITQVIIVYLSFFFFYKALKENDISRPGSILLYWTNWYFLFMSAGLNRIFLATSIIFYALQYACKNNWRNYFLFVILASTIHISSLIMLFLLVLNIKREMIERYWKIVLLVMIVFLPIVLVFVTKFIVPKLGGRYISYANINGLSLSIGNFDKIPIFLWALYFKEQIPKDKKRQCIIGLILLGGSCIISFFGSMFSYGRIVYYLDLGIILIISEVFSLQHRKKIDYLIKYIILCYAFIYLFYTTFANKLNSNMFPYKTFFNS